MFVHLDSNTQLVFQTARTLIDLGIASGPAEKPGLKELKFKSKVLIHGRTCTPLLNIGGDCLIVLIILTRCGGSSINVSVGCGWAPFFVGCGHHTRGDSEPRGGFP